MHSPNYFANNLLEVSLVITHDSQCELYRKVSAYTKIAQAYDKLGKPQQSDSIVETFYELNRKYLANDYFSLESLAEYYLKKGNTVKAIELLDLALASAKKESDYEERDDILDRLGTAFLRTGDFAKGLECAELIEDDYDRSFLYQCIASNYIQNGQHQEIDYVIKKTKETGFESLLLEEIVKDYLEQNDFGRALAAIEAIEHEQIKVEALSNVAQKYYDLGDTLKAIEILKQAEKVVNFINSSSSKSLALQAISRVWQKIDNSNSKTLLLNSVAEAKSIKDKFLQGFALNSLAFQLASAGKYEEAFQTIDIYNPFVPKFEKIRLLIAVAEQYQQDSQVEKAEQIIKNAIAIVPEIAGDNLAISDETAQSFAWNDIADYFIKHNQLDSAEKALSQINVLDGKLNVLVNIACFYITNNKYKKAHNVLNRAREILPKIKSNISLAYSIAIANHFATIGDYHSAIEVVKLIAGDTYKAETLTNIALQYTKFPQNINRETWEMLEAL